MTTGNSMNLYQVIIVFCQTFTVIGIFIAIKTFRNNVKSNKVQVTLHLHQQWSSSFMLEHRRKVWNHLDGLYFKRKKIKYSKLKTSEVFFSYSVIEHFFADLNTLVNQGLIDEELASSFFRSTVQNYMQRYNKCLVYDDSDAHEQFYSLHLKPVSESLKKLGRIK